MQWLTEGRIAEIETRIDDALTIAGLADQVKQLADQARFALVLRRAIEIVAKMPYPDEVG